MNFDGNIKILQKNVDISELVNFCNELTTEQWEEWDYRQNAFDTQQDTRTFPIMWGRNENIVLPPEPMNVDSLAWKLLQPYFRFLENLYAGRIYKALFVLLLPGGKISPHVDQGFGVSEVHRCHLALVSKDTVDFIIDGIKHYFIPGTWYEFNNTRIHSVSNNSDIGRVHLIVDILPL